MSNQPETMTVQDPGGDIVVTQAAFELTVNRYAGRTLGNLRDLVNERAGVEYRNRLWVQCIAVLADFDYNVDGDAFSADAGQRAVKRCIAHEPGMSLWECECRECLRLQRTAEVTA